MLKWLRLGLATVTATYAVAVAGAFALGFFGGRVGWPALARELAHLLFAPLPLLLLAALALRGRVALLLAIPPLGLLAQVYGQQLWPGAAPVAEGPRLRVLSFNVGTARGLGQLEPVLAAVRAADADVVCLVEARPDSFQTLGRALGDAYRYQAGNVSVFVFSRFPLLDARAGFLPSGAHDSLLVDVVVGDRLVSLAGVHLRRTDAYGGLGRGVGSLLRAGSSYDPGPRDAAVDDLTAHLRALGGTRVLAGDFNMSQWSHSYRELSAELTDSFREGGRGLGHTYPATSRAMGWEVSLPLLRIDYIFHSADLATVWARIGPLGGSDHLPIVADLAFR
jgi:vancomycin resistance protein VanJ